MSTVSPGVPRLAVSGSVVALLAILAVICVIPVKLYLFGGPQLPNPAFTLSQFAIVATFFLWPVLAFAAFVVLLLVRGQPPAKRRRVAILYGVMLGVLVLPVPWAVLIGGTALEATFWGFVGAAVGALMGGLASLIVEPALVGGNQGAKPRA